MAQKYHTREVPDLHRPVRTPADSDYLDEYRDAQENLYRKGGDKRAEERKEAARLAEEAQKSHDEEEKKKIQAAKDSQRPTIQDEVQKALANVRK